MNMSLKSDSHVFMESLYDRGGGGVVPRQTNPGSAPIWLLCDIKHHCLYIRSYSVNAINFNSSFEGIKKARGGDRGSNEPQDPLSQL